MKQNAGNVITEYGLVLGLLVLLCVGSLVLLGGNTSKLLGGMGQKSNDISELNGLITPNSQAMQTSAAQNAADSSGRGSTPKLPGSGYITVSLDDNGVPVLGKSGGTSGSVTNATSIEGNQWNSVGDFRLAGTMQALADNQTDPAVKAYLQSLADKAYMMGAAEGEIDGVKGLEIGNNAYNNIDALKDLAAYKTQLQALLAHPPAGMDSALQAQAMSMSANTYNIAQSYTNKLAYYLKTNTDFQLTSIITSCGTCGSTGDALTSTVSTMQDNGQGTHYTDIVPLAEVKTQAQLVLADNNATAPVTTTLNTAVTVENAAAASGG